MKQIVVTTNRLRKKKTDKYNSNDIELSTNKLAPGILKIFGDNVSQGSNYKAVRASSISSAQEVVRIALERYGFEGCNPRDYVLCDVVGEFKTSQDDGKVQTKMFKDKGSVSSNNSSDNERVWKPIYVRAINNIEKPLVLQSLWKPTHGKFRRFELRKRSEVDSSGFYINTSVSMGRRDSDISLFDYSENKMHTTTPELHAKQRESRRSNLEDFDLPPSNTPYLLMLKGYDPSDKLVHKLQKATTVVGPYKPKEEKQHDIILYSTDVILPVCFIYKKVNMDDNCEIDVDDLDFVISLEPLDTISITVDGVEVIGTTILTPGQLITFGESYLFLFKDPTTIKDVDLSLPWLDKIRDVNGDFSEHKNEMCSYLMNSGDMSGDSGAPIYATVKKKNDQGVQVEPNGIDIKSDEESDMTGISFMKTKLFVRSKLQLPYNVIEEDNLLHSIIEIMDDEVDSLGVIPSYLFLMAIEHSASNFTDIQTRKLLLKISSGMQGIAWEKTKGVGKSIDITQEEPLVVLRSLLSELNVVLFWMTNALEMLHYLQCNLQKYLLPRNQVGTNQHMILSADEELLSVLEDVIMFTFQQTIYHLTKVLHMTLPLLIDSKPDQSESEQGTKEPVHIISQVFEEILCCTKRLHIHPSITTQLFSYLFFFSNASLFNSLMEKGPTSNFFTGDRGLQLQTHVNILEQWAHENELGGEFDNYMSRFLCAIDLLATPLAELMPFDWKQLRQKYSVLTPAQLQLLLGEYQLNGKQKPRGWYPPPEEVERALEGSELLESFANHPPLVLPSSGFVVDLNTPPQSDLYLTYISAINERFDNKGEDSSYMDT